MVLVVAACTAGTAPDATVSPPDTTVSAEVPWSPSAPACVSPGESGSCDLDGYPDRPYEVFVPDSYEPGTAMSLVMAFHGGGGSSRNGATMSCPDGDVNDAGCLHGIGDKEGFVTVYPNGSGFLPLKRLRTWNAGGGSDGWNCASGKACTNDIDDLSYVDSLLEDLGSWLNIDQSRIYATGLSNGAALSHRLACQRAGTFAAIAAVAGSNQFATGATCDPVEPVAVLQVHGTEDPCWSYETTDARCIGSGGEKLGAVESMTGWVDVLGCSEEPIESDLPDDAQDGMRTVSTRWTGCDGGTDVLLLTVIGGGHTWPSGSPGLSERRVGPITLDWGSELLWDFLSQYTRRAAPDP